MAQKKEWAKFSDKAMGFAETLSTTLKLKERYRSCFPGLYSRQKNKAKKQEELERARDAYVLEKERIRLSHEGHEHTLGSANPNLGRRKKKVLVSATDDDDFSDKDSDPGSEPDLGPLRSLEQLDPDPYKHWDDDDHHIMLEDMVSGGPPMFSPGTSNTLRNTAGKGGFGMAGTLPGGFGTQTNEVERDDDAIELVLEATEYVVQGIKDRCRGARQLVLSEMGEARQVLQGIGNVLEVLGRRAQSLKAQQKQLLK